MIIKGKNRGVLSIHPEYYKFLKKVSDKMKRLKYSRNTLKSYLKVLIQYFNFIDGNISRYNRSQILKFLKSKVKGNKSHQTIKLYINALNFFYIKVLKKDITKLNIKDLKLRKSVNKNFTTTLIEINDFNILLDNIPNRKHRLMIMLSYYTGMQLGEVIRCKVGDFDFDLNIIYIKNYRGDLDRICPMPEDLSISLKDFTKYLNPYDWVFESERGGRLRERSIQKIFEMAIKRSGLDTGITFRSLRKTFAKNAFARGLDIQYIQKLLGHKNPRITKNYLNT